MASRFVSVRTKAMASVFVAPDPPILHPQTLLVSRCHYLWALVAEKPVAMQRRLVRADSQDALLARLDRALRNDSNAFAVREQRRARMVALERKMRALAVASLEGR